MQNGAYIGSTVVIKGDVSAEESVSIAGRLEGKMDASGHAVTIEAGGQVHADIAAGTIIVCGTVRGCLVAEERMELRNTADVEGDLTVPRMSIADGAMVKGQVQIASERPLKIARAS